jgi:hypothetical protein
MFLDLLDVALAGRHVDIEHFEPAVEELVQRRPGARVAMFVDLGESASACPLGLARSGRSTWDGLGQVVLRFRHRVDAGVDPHAQ